MDIVSSEQQEGTLKLEGLPHSLLTEISSYLCGRASNCPRTIGSDVLLAVALTSSKSSWDKLQYDNTTDLHKLLSPATKAVLSMHTENWGKRFEEFDLYHARLNVGQLPETDVYTHDRLNDIDLKAILICIDARNNVKSLILNMCANITGRGLEVLAGSNVIERIDLSLISGDYNYNKYDMEKISLCEGIVLPLLHSIIEGGSSSLRHVQLPLKWRNSRGPELDRFMEEYNDYLENMYLTCQHEWKEGGIQKKCENECAMGMHLDGERYGIQTATCSKCVKHFCTETDCIDEEPSFDYCGRCQKYHCYECNYVYDCNKCQKSSCFECYEVHLCHECSKAFCYECRGVWSCSECYKSVCESCGPIAFCSGCQECFCEDCGDVTYCEMCEDAVCSDCVQRSGALCVCEHSYG